MTALLQLMAQRLFRCTLFFDGFCSLDEKNRTDNADHGKDRQHNKDLIETDGDVAGGFGIANPRPDNGGQDGVGEEDNEGNKARCQSRHFCGDTCLSH